MTKASSSAVGVTTTQGRPHLEEVAEALQQKDADERAAKEKPRGPVSERFMKHHYGASGYVPPADDTQPLQAPTQGRLEQECVRCGGCDQPVPHRPDVRCIDCLKDALAALEGAQQRITELEARIAELEGR